jgi:23S rRNA (pseudouridine1915-N3)-methyltransferase
MNISIISVGKLKEKYLKDGIDEYKKRLSRYCSIDIIEVPDEKAPENLSEKEEEQIKIKEGQAILKYVKGMHS